MVLGHQWKRASVGEVFTRKLQQKAGEFRSTYRFYTDRFGIKRAANSLRGKCLLPVIVVLFVEMKG